jgi:hypothetical protein
MKGLFKQWNKRNLTPIGKITVVKSLILLPIQITCVFENLFEPFQFQKEPIGTKLSRNVPWMVLYKL